MIFKKCTPALLLALVGRLLGEIARDGCEAYGESELPKLGMDLPRSPTVFQCEAIDEGLDFHRNTGSPGTALRNPSPIEPEAFAMPTDHRIRFYEDEDCFPACTKPEEHNPKRPIERRELGLRSRLSIRRKLLAQRQLDDRLLTAAPEEGEATAKKCRREIEESLHRGGILRDFSAQTQTDSLPDPCVP